MVGALSILLIILSGSICWWGVSKDSSIFEIFVFGSVLGLVLSGFGVIASRSSNQFAIRFLPLIFVPIVILMLTSRHILKQLPSFVPEGLRLPIFLSLIVLAIALSPLVEESWKAGSLHGQGFYSIYPDLQFYWSAATESISRVPKVFPHLSENNLVYTWLYSGTMGSIAGFSDIPVSQLIFIVWPLYYVLISISAIFLIVYRAINNQYWALIGAVFFVFFKGPHSLVEMQWITASPIYMLSPQRDFATLAVLTLVALLISYPKSDDLKQLAYAVLIALCSFVACGSKGSTFLLLMVGGGCAGLLSLFNSRLKNWGLLYPWIAVGIGSVSAQFLVTRIKGDLQIDFWSKSIGYQLGAQAQLFSNYFYLFILGWCLLACFLLVHHRNSFLTVEMSLFFVGVPLAALLGIMHYSHPGVSQVYFWQSAIPILAVMLPLALHAVNRVRGSAPLLYFAISWLFFELLYQENHFSIRRTITYMILSSCLFLLTGFTSKGSTKLRIGRRCVAAIGMSALGILSASSFGLHTQVRIGGWSDSPSEGSINQGVIRGLQFLKSSSQPYDLIITNKHCNSGSLKSGTCDERFLMFSAVSERRFLTESRLYSWRNTEPVDHLELSDKFIAAPSEILYSALKELGVDFVFVDKRERFSQSLSNFGNIIFEHKDCLILKLDE